MTAYSASFGSTVVFASFVDSMLSSHTVTFRLARARSPVECGRPPTGGPVRSDSGKNVSVLPVMERGPKGPSDSGRTVFFPGRNGPARPSAAGRSRPPGHSRPFCRAGSGNHETPCPPRNTSSYVSGGHAPYIRDIVSDFPCLLSEIARSVHRASRPAQRVTHTQRSTIPRYTRGTTRPAAASRRL